MYVYSSWSNHDQVFDTAVFSHVARDMKRPVLCFCSSSSWIPCFASAAPPCPCIQYSTQHLRINVSFPFQTSTFPSLIGYPIYLLIIVSRDTTPPSTKARDEAERLNNPAIYIYIYIHICDDDDTKGLSYLPLPDPFNLSSLLWGSNTKGLRVAFLNSVCCCSCSNEQSTSSP